MAFFSRVFAIQVGYVPRCEAIEIEAYKPSASNLRLAHNQICPNLATFIPDTDGRVRTYSPAPFPPCSRFLCSAKYPLDARIVLFFERTL
jgi:hypothetical protein